MKILLTIQYNGAAFSGWQKQKSARTVQQTLEEKISALLGENIELHASGRTDSGVHAIAQTAHFETTKNFSLTKLPHAINAGLPKDVSVLSAKKVKQAFHARFSVKQKTYLYRTYASDIILPLLDATHARVHKDLPLALDRVKAAASHLVGTHNFKAFCSAHTSAQTFERTIFDIKIKKSGNVIDFYVTGSGFLYNMVRIIVGTLIDVGIGKIHPDQIPEIIKNQDRTKSGKTMPPHGLYLYKVKY